MSSVDFNLLNAKLLKRLHDLRNYAPNERFRLLKRYTTHFVKLVQCGRHFEASFKEHLQLTVTHLNDRGKHPIEMEILGTIVKTLCVICCITAVSHHIVMIAAEGLLEIFVRISYKETFGILKFCGNHFIKLLSHLSRFGHFRVQQLFIEIVFASLQIYGTLTERQAYIQKISKVSRICLEPLLAWESSQISAKSRALLMRLQEQSFKTDVFSLPVENFLVDDYRIRKIDESNILWLDFNFNPATISFCSSVVVFKGVKRQELIINIEIAQHDITRIELKQCCALELVYKNIAIEPEVLNAGKEGILVFEIPSYVDCSRFNDEIIPRIRKNFRMEIIESQPSLVRLNDLLNVSILESVVSGSTTGKKASKLDQSLRLQENRNIIEHHRNMRCQLLSNSSAEGSNKENERPNALSQNQDVAQEIQPLRVFETLRKECQQQQNRSLHVSKRECSEIETVPHEQSSGKQSFKKRKLFEVKEDVKEELNSSKDSQIERSKYVERKLVNTVKPMKTNDINPGEMLPEPTTDVLNVSEVMSSEEFDQSLQAYIKYNGIFGITQQKILDKKLEKNIRKINEMVDRSTKKFFKRDPAPDNPYEFNEPSRNNSKTKTVKKRNTKANRVSDDEEYLPNKSVKNKANASRRRRTAQQFQSKLEIVPSRVSLHRAKKPIQIIDLASDDSGSINRMTIASIDDRKNIPLKKTFEDLDNSSIYIEKSSKEQFDHQNSLPGQSTPSVKLNSKSIPRHEQKTSNKHYNGRERFDARRRAPLLEINSSSSIVMARNYKKPLQNAVTALIEKEKQTGNSYIGISLSDDSMTTNVSIEVDDLTRPNPSKTNAPQLGTSTLTEALVKQHLSTGSSFQISSSLEANLSGGNITVLPDNSNEQVTSRFNLDYANNNYLLNKFIAINNVTAQIPLCIENTKDLNESINSEEIRVGNLEGNPPSSLYDTSDLQSTLGNNPLTKPGQIAEANTESRKRKMVDLRQEVLTKRQDRISCHDPSNDIFQGNGKRQYDLPPSRKLSCESETVRFVSKSTAITSRLTNANTMIDQFKFRIHQELNPSLLEMENKINKLNDMNRAIESLSANLQAEDIIKKCDEIIVLEKRVDGLLNDVTNMCRNSMERGNHAIGLSQKFVKYDKTKRENYKLQLQGGQQEIPEIVDECVKNIWNQQVRGRLESFISKLMM